VMAWLRQARASGLLASLEEVTTDMWGSYVQAVHEVFGDTVRITIDRFHVMKNFQDCLSKARRQLQKQLPKEAAVELKGTRWLWLTNLENLDDADRQTLKAIQDKFPALAALSEQREKLRTLFEDVNIVTADQGMARLRQWAAKARELGLAGLDAFCATLDNWMDKIANYFVSRSSNGRTEGFNHGIRAILWRGYGIPNFEHLRLRILHIFA